MICVHVEDVMKSMPRIAIPAIWKGMLYGKADEGRKSMVCQISSSPNSHFLRCTILRLRLEMCVSFPIFFRGVG